MMLDWPTIARALQVETLEATGFLTGKLPADAITPLGWREIDTILNTINFEPGIVRLVGAESVEASTYVETTLGSGEILHRKPRRRVFTDLLRDGATLNINKAERVSAALRRIIEGAEYALNDPVWVNGYACFTDTSAFGRHSDPHPVVIVQTAGRKHWQVYDGEDMIFDQILQAGDVLFVPRGWDHRVSGVGEESVHWTIGFGHTQRLDAERALVGRTDKLACEDTIASYKRYRSWTSLDRRVGLSLPWVLADIELSAGDTLRWAAKFPPVVETQESGKLRILTLGMTFLLPAELAPVLERWSAGDSLAWEQVAALCRLTEADTHAWCRELIQQGLVIVGHA